MRTLTITALAAVALAAITGCSSSDKDPSGDATANTSTAPTAAPTPDPTTAPPKAFGTTLEWEATDGSVSGTSTVLSYQQGFKSAGTANEEVGAAGYAWAAVELKVCSTKGTFLATTTPWTLSYADGARIEPSSSTYEDFPKPEFPFETKLTTGKCVRGKVVYPVPDDERPATVVYAPQDSKEPVEWAVPPK